MDVRGKVGLILAGVAIAAGVLLIVLPVAPRPHWHYEGNILVAPEQLEDFKVEYALKASPLGAPQDLSVVMDSRGSTVYHINVDTEEALNLEGMKYSLRVQEVRQDALWVRVLSVLLIGVGTLTALCTLPSD